MSLRIVAGEAGGRRIAAPPGRGTRPTREAVREAWFSALGPGVEGARVLDLFAGSGALGLEALSRGAERVDFVERDPRAAAVARSNLAALGWTERGRVHAGDALVFVDRSAEEEWDLVLADPPYGGREAERLLERFVQRPFARLLCLEHDPGSPVAKARADWRRRYGDTMLSFFRASEPSSSATGGTHVEP